MKRPLCATTLICIICVLACTAQNGQPQWRRMCHNDSPEFLKSASILKFLMEIDNPSPQIKRAVHAGMQWLDEHKLTGLRVERVYKEGIGYDRTLIEDPDAPALWARYYDLVDCQPFVCDRDGIPRRNLDEIGYERRNGYSWYNNTPLEIHLFELYDKWKTANK